MAPLALAALPLVAGVFGLVRPASALMLGGALVVGAAVQASLGFLASKQERVSADRLLLAGNSLPSELEWRKQELTGARERGSLARSLRSLVSSLGRDVVLTAQVVNRPAARAQSAKLTALADRLERVEDAVSARGILLVRRLLTDGRSPLFDRARAAELPDDIDTALRALDSRR